MRYFKAKKVIIPKPEDTVLSLVSSNEPTFLYDEIGNVQYYGVDTKDVQEFLSEQHLICEVAEITYEEIEPILASCRFRKDIELIKKSGCSEENYTRLLREFGLVL